MKRSSKWLLLIGLSGPAAMTLSCGSVLLIGLRDLGISVFLTVAEDLAFDLVEQFVDLDDGSTTTP